MSRETAANFGFGDDETLVRDSARRFLDSRASIDKVHKLVASDHRSAYEGTEPPLYEDKSFWREVVELGWTALAVPETAGGLGMSLSGIAGVAEEIGRHAMPSPFESTLLATLAVRAAGSGNATRWLQRVAAGHSASLAVCDHSGSWEVRDTGIVTRQQGDRWMLEGTAWFVQDARKVDSFVVAARGADGVGLFSVAADARGIRINPDRILDLTRDQAHVEFSGVELGPEDVLTHEAEAVWRAALPAMLTVVSAEIAGAAEQQLQTMTEYARIRTQFDRPIGFFQAVKHPIVDVMLGVDQVKSLVYDAAYACDCEPQRAETAARMAKASACDAALFASNRSMQLHGGIAMTWEANIHIHFKRQHHTRALFGDAALHRQMLAELCWD